MAKFLLVPYICLLLGLPAAAAALETIAPLEYGTGGVLLYYFRIEKDSGKGLRGYEHIRVYDLTGTQIGVLYHSIYRDFPNEIQHAYSFALFSNEGRTQTASTLTAEEARIATEAFTSLTPLEDRSYFTTPDCPLGMELVHSRIHRLTSYCPAAKK